MKALRNMFGLAAGLALTLWTGVSLQAQSCKPIRALMITGGCCHDYENQKNILSTGISARANVEWTILHEGGTDRNVKVSIYSQPDWAKGYDVVVHNECFGGVTDDAFIDGIAKGHEQGVAAVVIHCSMHSYRNAKTDEWRKLLGVSSYRHQHHTPFDVKNLQPDHPVMKDFPCSWTTPNGELYEIVKLWPNCRPLAWAYGTRTQQNQVCIWTNTYGKARVFGTTIGHDNETMDNEIYLGMITRGLLWACDRLDEDGQPKPGYGPQGK